MSSLMTASTDALPCLSAMSVADTPDPEPENQQALGQQIRQDPESQELGRPEYSTYNDRIRTFVDWPETAPVTPHELAEAGLYYTGIQDKTMCFCCGTVLHQWDADDDAWTVHSGASPTCPYVKQKKDSEFVDDATKKFGQAAERTCGEDSYPMVKNLSEQRLDVPDNIINEAIRALDESEEEVNEENLRRMIRSLTYWINTRGTPFPRETDSRTSELEEIENLCRICYTEERNVAMLPCGHVSSCVQCSTALSTCPICRGEIEGYVRVNL